jgi:hypothetical protein
MPIVPEVAVNNTCIGIGLSYDTIADKQHHGPLSDKYIKHLLLYLHKINNT